MSNRLKNVLRAVGEARERRGLAAEEALIFLALGQLSLMSVRAGYLPRPVAFKDIAALLKIPKETVRRKAGRLVEMELAISTPRGMLVKNADEWQQLADQLVQ